VKESSHNLVAAKELLIRPVVVMKDILGRHIIIYNGANVSLLETY